MITLLNNAPDFSGKTLGFIETKILSNFIAYGTNYPFLNFWQGVNEGIITSTICKFEDTIFVCASDGANFNELREFLEVIGFSSLQAEEGVLRSLGFANFDEYVCLSCDKAFSSEYNPPSLNLKSLYKVIFEDKDKNLTPPEFDGWYADLSHRIRHGTAVAVMEKELGGAIASHIAPHSAVISGVRVANTSQGKGVGKTLVKNLLSLLQSKTVYTATDCKTAEFYIKCGFNPIGKIGVFRKC